MNKRLIVLVCLLVFVSVGAIEYKCGLFEFAEKRPEDSSDIWSYMGLADEITIYALDPYSDSDKYAKGVFSHHRFDYDIVGMATVKDKSEIIYLTSLFMRTDAFNSSTEALCFEPRHAVSFNGHWVAVCFECLQYEANTGHGQLSQFEIMEVNEFYERHDVIPLRSSHNGAEIEFLNTSLEMPHIIRRELQKRYFELTNSISEGSGLSETWQRGEEQARINYSVVPAQEEEESEVE